MPNPYAARVSRSAPQSVSELDQFVGRLRSLGATPDEIVTVRETWDAFDTDWTPERRGIFVRLPDDALRAELLATRQDFDHDTRTEQEQGAVDAAGHVARVHRDAADVIGRSVGEVLGWVGADAIRAMAVLDLELGPDGGGRKTLVKPLEAMLDPDAAGVQVEVVSG